MAAIITVVVGVFYELTPAIFTGVALSVLLFVFTLGDRARMVAWVPETPDGAADPLEGRRLRRGRLAGGEAARRPP